MSVKADPRMQVLLPEGYIDATSCADIANSRRVFVLTEDHPYCQLRDRVLAVVQANSCSCVDEELLTDKIMDVI